LIFALTFTITKFSGAGVPGGSVLVMIPVLESCLGFTHEMTALITICYMLIDPIASSGNVIGNNLFVIHFSKFYGFVSKKRA
jgi:Na+/H+-dicarboxylate symporter